MTALLLRAPLTPPLTSPSTAAFLFDISDNSGIPVEDVSSSTAAPPPPIEPQNSGESAVASSQARSESAITMTAANTRPVNAPWSRRVLASVPSAFTAPS